MLTSRIKVCIAEYEVKTGKPVQHQDIAKYLGVTKQYFSEIVNGHVILKMDKAHKLAHFLGCTVNELYEYKEE